MLIVGNDKRFSFLIFAFDQFFSRVPRLRGFRSENTGRLSERKAAFTNERRVRDAKRDAFFLQKIARSRSEQQPLNGKLTHVPIKRSPITKTIPSPTGLTGWAMGRAVGARVFRARRSVASFWPSWQRPRTSASVQASGGSPKSQRMSPLEATRHRSTSCEQNLVVGVTCKREHLHIFLSARLISNLVATTPRNERKK